MKVFKVKVSLEPVVKVIGLSKLEPVLADDIISNLKGEYCIHHAVRTEDEYVGYKKHIRLKLVCRREAKAKEL